MLHSVHDLRDYSIAATDGNIGKVTDLLFDDNDWVVRYFVVQTDSWLSSRKVLISPIGIQKVNWLEKVFHVLCTRDQVKNSPRVDTDKTISRQQEIDQLDYHSYPYYWGNTGFWGDGMYPHLLNSGFGQPEQTPKEADDIAIVHEAAIIKRHKNDDPNLRSSQAIIGYHIHASDGDIGHVSGIIIEDQSMSVRYLIIDTTNWFGGHKVLISPEWIKEMKWLDKSVTINLTRDKIKKAPHYNPNQELSRNHELAVYKHYGFENYWDVY